MVTRVWVGASKLGFSLIVGKAARGAGYESKARPCPSTVPALAMLLALAHGIGCGSGGNASVTKQDAAAVDAHADTGDGGADLVAVADSATGADHAAPPDGPPGADVTIQPGADASADVAPDPSGSDANTEGAVDKPATTDAVSADGDANAVADGDAKPATDTGITPTDDAAASCNVCSAYGTATLAGRLAASNLDNVSGMAASHRNPGVLFVHNDLTRTEFFALDEAGTLLGTYSFPATSVVDLEDVAVGPCPSGSCLFLADIGGNTSSRTTFAILRLAEPAVTLGQAAASVTVTAEKLTFSYPDGANHNAESLLVEPATGELYIITKESSGPSTVYKLPTTFGAAAAGAAQMIVQLTVPTTADGPATGSSAHPCGAGFLLRTNNIIYEFRAPLGSTLAAAFAVTPLAVPFLKETQGEAVTYRSNGLGYFQTGEGATQPINQVGCK